MNQPAVTQPTNIIVVGGGGCGLAAALAAAAHGKKVVLLERAPNLGGSTSMSAGIIVAAGSHLQIDNGETGSAEELAADILRLNDQASDVAVTKALCGVSGELIDWLVALGVPLEHMATYRYPGMSRSWLHSPPSRSGAPMIDALTKRAERHPAIALYTKTRVSGLLSIAEDVTGVKALQSDGTELTIHAEAVILAASGFGANQAAVARYIPSMATAAYYGAPYANGDAIEWGQAVGGQLDYMGCYQAHSSIASPELMLVTTYLINHGAFQVNQQGHRFGNETETYAAHALSVQEQPGGIAIEVFDERILRQTLSEYPRFSECLHAGIVHSADTIEGLATIFGVDEVALAATTEKYNRSLDAGVDEFGRRNVGMAMEAPYYGIRVTSALIQTLGGLRVDGHGRVLRADGSAVHGLYAGGGTAAGLAGDRSESYLAGSGLLAAFGLGLLAGRHAASN